MAANFFPLFASILFFFPFFSHVIMSDSGDEKSNPYEYLKRLQGCQNGEKVQGLGELKRYLKTLGYLYYPHQVDEDEFDDLLEDAIKTYQLNYNLNISGSLDSATVNKMMMPRCGVADIIDGSTSMQSGKQRRQHSHGSGSLHTVAHYSFFAGTPRWPASKTHLNYSFLSDADVLGPPCARAFQKWASVSHFTFEETPNYNTADIKISFQIGDHGDGNPFDGPGGVLSHAFAPTDGRLHFDGQEQWATSPTAGKYDLETVALHDIGHILGLAHSSVADAIMYPTIASGVSKNLHGDDIEGIRSLYGSTNREIIPKGTNVYTLVCPMLY